MAREKLIYSKKGQRKISSFFGQELLYDYVSNKLDQERISAVEDYVKESRDAQAEVQKIHNAMNYLEHLSDTQVSAELVEEIKKPSTYFDQLLKRIKFDEWPEGMKLGLDVIVVSIGVISIILVVPWHKLMEVNFSRSKDVVLLEIEKTKPKIEKEIPSSELDDKENQFPDEGVEKVAKKDEPPPQKRSGNNKETGQTDKTEAPSLVAKNNDPPKTKKTEPIEEIKTLAPEEEAHNATSPTVAAAIDKHEKPEKRQGFLYRGEIHVANLKATTEKFVSYITELGGRKAGEVPIGWSKGNSTYFHFTMPEAKNQNLIDYMKEYGELKIQKEKHDRIMPEGIIRIIITVYEKK